MKKQLNNEKINLQRAMATVIKAAGYNLIAKEVRQGKNIKENVLFFLRQYKRSMYGLRYIIAPNGTRVGRINQEKRDLYDRTEKNMLIALKKWSRL